MSYFYTYLPVVDLCSTCHTDWLIPIPCIARNHVITTICLIGYIVVFIVVERNRTRPSGHCFPHTIRVIGKRCNGNSATIFYGCEFVSSIIHVGFRTITGEVPIGIRVFVSISG
jgi:hypothetical protein